MINAWRTRWAEGTFHPKNKQDVGKRRALAARALVYGEKIVYSGPIYDR
jgi:sialate O-acetylesterase